ncbi:fluoride efflux transporter CrcB [Lactimicrobium sp.]|jgi:CrcB protein|uniref:fluoride efflux transporter CrcB n=1 Tax=Lactimicrobium sp. TaxID=2563780 RepID=UPI002F35AAB3
MRKYIFIGCGSFAGAALRYLVKSIQIYNYRENVPLNTLFINVLGALIIAFILTIAYEVWAFDSDIRLGLTTGLLGAFTTFSTLCKETVGLLQDGYYFSAISYMTVSVMLGLASAYFGVVLARKLGSKVTEKREKLDKLTEKESDVD